MDGLRTLSREKNGGRVAAGGGLDAALSWRAVLHQIDLGFLSVLGGGVKGGVWFGRASVQEDACTSDPFSQAFAFPHRAGGLPRSLRQALAKWPPNPRAYLFGARAASAVRTLLGPALGDAASCPPCLGCPWVSSRSPLHARGALQGRPRRRALASTCMSWQLDAADAGSARPTAHPAERV